MMWSTSGTSGGSAGASADGADATVATSAKEGGTNDAPTITAAAAAAAAAAVTGGTAGGEEGGGTQQRIAEYTFDKGREIRSLLVKHKAQLEKLQALLPDAGIEGGWDISKTLFGVKMDTIWLLRFLMSYETAEVAAKKVAEAVAYMRKNRAILEPSVDVLPLLKAMSKALPIRFIGRAKNGDTVSYTRHNSMEPALLYKEIGADTEFSAFMLRYSIWKRHQNFLHVDRLTRKEGHIVKVMDVQGEFGERALRTREACRGRAAAGAR